MSGRAAGIGHDRARPGHHPHEPWRRAPGDQDPARREGLDLAVRLEVHRRAGAHPRTGGLAAFEQQREPGFGRAACRPAQHAQGPRLQQHEPAVGGHRPLDVLRAAEVRRLVLLQSRPLRMRAGRPAARPSRGSTMLLAGGETGVRGVGSGPVVHIDEDSELDAFPDGGVLVARRPSPRSCG